jgi:hypothetical protein
MNEKYAVVVTTINYPTKAVQEISRAVNRLSAEFILIGDQKSPADFDQPGSTYLNLAAQQKSGFKYALLAPIQHYARKNVGYLTAIRNGATIIIETDDDNIPREAFWNSRRPTALARVVKTSNWVNVYAYYTDRNIWPRGFPLNCIKQAPPPLADLILEKVHCPIQQGLADENPDVDAIYRLILPLPVTFRVDEPVALRGAWCPFNSQNTTWWQETFPLLYLPYYCSFRMTDIWRSFVAQRIAYLNGWSILYHAATVFQQRNEHDILRDFDEEIPGYLHNERIRTALDSLNLPVGRHRIPSAMRACYERLVALALIGPGELQLLDVWLEDLADIGKVDADGL